MTIKIFKKTLSVILTLNLLLQSFAPYLVGTVYAEDSTPSATTQEITPTPSLETAPEPTQEVTPTPTQEITPTPTSEPTPIITPEATPSPTIELTPTIEITPTTTPDVSPEPTSNTQAQAPPQENSTSNDESLETSSPVTEVTTSPESADVPVSITTATQLEQTLTPQPTLTSDKADYFPTDIAYISGTGFNPNETYTLHITSSDNPFVSTYIEVTADENGQFTYAYQLDGHYRPNYSVTALNASGNVVSAYTFTDSSEICTVDVEGANDVSGQKDLTKMCFDSNVTNVVNTTWQWDEISWTGNNTGDACNLFDTDNDGKINYAICVTIGGSPAVIQSTTRYSCGDDKVDRCTSPATSLAVSGNTTCSVNTVSSDPFPAGDASPSDTKGACTIDTLDVGGSSAKLVDVCSYPSQQPNSSPSDCISAISGDSGKLEVKKVLYPSNDPGLFNLLVNGVELITNIGNGGTTGERVLTPGTYTVSESAGTSTNLSNYSSSVECRGSNGAGAIVASSSSSGTVNVSLVKNADIVCTITNTINNGTLTVQKTTLPSGDTTQFTINATGSGTIIGGGSGTISDSTDKVYTVTAGTYSVTETIPSGWSQTSNTCTNVVVTSGGSATCTITNTKNATLTVTKIVTNDNGGTKVASDFPLFVDNTQVISGVANTFSIGAHVVSETPDSDYTAVISGDCDASGNVTLSAGDSKACTITNNDIQPKLTVTKIVTNDNGGTKVVSDFPLYVDNTSVTSGVQNSFNAGTYTVSELSRAGYTAVISGDCDAYGSITLTAGDVKSCTITNSDFAPQLTVIKHVVNDNGGSLDAGDFTMNVSGNNVSLSSFSGSESGTVITLDAGNYSVDEIEVYGYTKTLGANCSGTIAVGESKTCVITNDDQTGLISGYKYDASTGLGILGWTIYLTGASTAQTTTDASGFYQFLGLNSGLYTVTEATPSDWTAVSPTSYDVTINPGTEATSGSFTNFHNISISGQKFNDLDGDGFKDDGEPGLSGWVINLNGVDSATTDANGNYLISNLGPGSYTITEDQQVGWIQTTANPSVINAVSGQNVTGVNFGNQMRGSITIVKDALPNSTASFSFSSTIPNNSAFSLVDNSDNSQSRSKTISNIGSGTYTITEAAKTGWKLTGIVCTGDSESMVNVNSRTATITLNNPNENVTCTFTNTRYGSISGFKFEDENGNGTKNSEDLYLDGWTISLLDSEMNLIKSMVTGAGNLSLGKYTFGNLLPGTYNVCETIQTGWEQSYPSTGVTLDGLYCHTINLGAGQTPANRNFGNVHTPSITLIKSVVTDHGGTAGVNDFGLTVGENSVNSGEKTNVSVNTPYSINEVGLAGYKFISISGDEQCPEVLGGTITLYSGDDITCTITNDDEPGTLIVRKVVNGSEEDASNFSFTVNESEPIYFETESGENTITVPAGVYTVTETKADGYTTTYDNCSEVSILNGESKTCTITNTYVEPTLTISRSNNAETALTPGSSFEQTITITVHGNDISGLKLKDLLSKGILFGGTYSVVKNGNVSVSLATPPSYNSPGDWELGDFNKGDVITIKYIANINSDILPGTYTDLAWAVANSPVNQNSIYATGENSEYVNDIFVGTDVEVIRDQSRSDDYTVEKKEEVIGQVLGASTLPDTGANELWLLASLLSLYFGIKLVRSSKEK